MHGEEDMLIQIWNAGTLTYSSHPSIALPLQPHIGKSAVDFEEQDWHVYRIDENGTAIQVAQPYSNRRAFVREMAWHTLSPILVQIPLIGLLIWLAVGRSLSPLHAISRAIRERSAISLAPLEIAPVPKEVQFMVQELNALLTRLDTALNAQQQFTMDAAHELRTPLAALKLQLGNLERAHNAAEQKRAIARLHHGIDRATHVAQQLLTLARLQPEPAAHTRTPVDLAQLAHLAVENYAEIAYASRIDLGYPRHEPATVPGDAGSLRIVIDNLIDNALRYTPPGGKVDVAVFMQNAEARIEVKDTGIGIAEHERTRIFERFYRVIGTQTNGTGLGLAIVKHIVEAHNGRIRIGAGIDGAGTGFTICLPV
jgi:two-component system OmpR family sensor kinase